MELSPSACDFGVTAPFHETHWLVLEAISVARTQWNLPDALDIRHYAELVGVRVKFRRLIGEGEYIRTRPPQVLLRANRLPERTNFTFAHELGHHFLAEVRKNPDVRVRVSHRARREIGFLEPASAREESFCDAFAPGLIVGETQVATFLQKGGLNAATVMHLATCYGLSLSATQRRLAALGHPCGFILAAPKQGTLHVVRNFGTRVPEGSEGCTANATFWWNQGDGAAVILWRIPGGRQHRVEATYAWSANRQRVGILLTEAAVVLPEPKWSRP